MKTKFELDSKWTAHPPRAGWRHFRIVARRYPSKDLLEVEVMAVCDRKVRFWIPSQQLLDKDKWSTGWLP